MDDLLSQTDQDAASVQEMEQLLGSMPELSGVPSVSDEVGKSLVETPDELRPMLGQRVNRNGTTQPNRPQPTESFRPPRRGERSR
jgi:hypothetical protein